MCSEPVVVCSAQEMQGKRTRGRNVVASAPENPKAPSRPKTRLIIFDLHSILCNIVHVRSGEPLRRGDYVDAREALQFQFPALIIPRSGKGRRLVTAREDVRTFLEKVSALAHVVIWTSMSEEIAAAIVAWLCGTSLKPPMLLSQQHCTKLYSVKLRRLFMSADGAAATGQHFKELELLWRGELRLPFADGFVPSVHNTLLVDSSPLACHLNPRGSCIFPKPWGGPEDPETDLGTNLLHIVEAVIQAEDSPPDVVNAVFENLLKARDVSVGGVTKALKRSGFHKRVRPSKDVLMNL